MKTKKRFLAFAMILSIFSVSVSFARGDKEEQQEKQKDQQAAMEKDRKVTGTILDHKVVDVYGTRQDAQEAQEGKKKEPANKALVTMIKTDKGNERLMVDLGPIDKVPEIKNGETQLKAEGRLVKVGQRQLFIASKAQVGEKMIKIQRKKG